MRFLLLLALAACAPKTAPVTDTTSRPTTLAALQVPLDTGIVRDAPPAFVDGLTQALASRGLAATSLQATELPEGFDTRRAAAFRGVALAEGAGQPVVLVEAVARYFSPLNGQFRWEVEVTATVADPALPEGVVSKTFTVPVFLRFQHQDEADAIAMSTAVVQRRVAKLVDAALGPEAPR